jgi:hypothetical protein
MLLSNLTAKALILKDSIHKKPQAVVMHFGGSYSYGLADLGKRFPAFSTIQAGAYFKTRNNFLFGFEYNRFLGNQFHFDSLYGGIVGPSEQMIDKNGNPALIRYYMRGFNTQAYVGKLFAISDRIKYGKIQVNFGAGFLQHYIKMRFDKGLLPQLEGNYAEGYDRLCNGLMLLQSVYYQYYNLQNLSFFCGINMVESFTQNQRNWDYGTMHKDNKKRNDFYTGFSFGILIPIQLKPTINTEYYD